MEYVKNLLPSVTGEVLITQKCNLNCSYCFEKGKNGKDMDLKELINALSGEGQFSTLAVSNFYIFGGEPLMNLSLVEDLISYLEKSDIEEEKKKRYIASVVNNLITNGVLIDKYIDVLKRHNISLQISLDGYEDINDSCRVDFNGKGHFKEIMANVELCRKEGVPYTFHGACSKDNYKNFSKICEFFLEEELKNPNGDISFLFYRNFCQIVMEEDITDEDIDILLGQFYETVKMIMETPLLDGYMLSKRKEIAEGFCLRRGGICSAGSTMFSYDNEFNVFPCHRLNTDSHNKHNRLTSLKEADPYFDYKGYLQFQEVARRGEMYGAVIDNFGYREPYYWLNWCPATNWEISGNVFQIPSKHGVLIAELQRFIPALAEYFDLDLDNPIFKGR